MSDAQVGKYIRLLSVQFQSPDGRLKPDYFDEKVGSDADIRCKFHRDEKGYFNEKMEEERQRSLAYSESRKKNISKRYKKQNDTENSCQENNTSEPTCEATHVEHMNLHTESKSSYSSFNDLSISKEDINNQLNDTEKVSKQSSDILDAQVEAIYQTYPRKKGRGQALRAIKTALKEIDFEILLKHVQDYAVQCKGQNPEFIPYPATWFNGKRWLDEKDSLPMPALSKFRELQKQKEHPQTVTDIPVWKV